MHTVSPVARVEAALADLIPDYLRNRWTDLDLAQQLLAHGEFERLARMARRIGASAGGFGFVGLGEIAQALAEAASMGDRAATAWQLSAFAGFLRDVRIEYV